MLKPLSILTLLGATAAQADLSVTFSEGAPKDRFALTNTGDCTLPAGTATIDIGTSPAGLIFDVTSAGAGVEVFQPFDVVAGADTLRSLPRVTDGDSAITLKMKALGVGQSIAFTIDVDDTGGAREITVNGSEIAGASVRVTLGDTQATGTFDTSAKAQVQTSGCSS